MTLITAITSTASRDRTLTSRGKQRAAPFSSSETSYQALTKNRACPRLSDAHIPPVLSKSHRNVGLSLTDSDLYSTIVSEGTKMVIASANPWRGSRISLRMYNVLRLVRRRNHNPIVFGFYLPLFCRVFRGVSRQGRNNNLIYIWDVY